MFGNFIQPLAFDGALTPEETAEAAQIRTLQFELLNGLSEAQLLGLAAVDEISSERMQNIGKLQQSLNEKIWDRHDPGAERRKAHYEAQRAEFENMMRERFGLNQESCGDDSCEEHGNNKKSLVSRVKNIFSRKQKDSTENTLS